MIRQSGLIGIAIAALFLIGGAHAAAEGTYTDRAGDAPAGFDIAGLDWETDGSKHTVSLKLVEAQMEAAGYSAILYLGREGAAEPNQWYVLHRGPSGDAVYAGHDLNQTVSANVTGEGTEISWTFATGNFDCAFAVARTVEYRTAGQVPQDVIGWTSSNIGGAWNEGKACSAGQPQDVAVETRDVYPEFDGSTNNVPAAGLVPLIAGLVALALARRR